MNLIEHFWENLRKTKIKGEIFYSYMLEKSIVEMVIFSQIGRLKAIPVKTRFL